MAPWRILVADDEPYVLMAIREVLLTLPAAVLEAQDGEKALRLTRTKRPDLVILDVKMPRMDGFQVIEALKREASTREIPVMFVSALGSPQEKVRGLALGAEDYMAKPLDPEELKARVQTILRRIRPKEPELSATSGPLKVADLASLVRRYQEERRTARLLLTRGDERGEVAFADGQIAWAVQGPRQGEAAVYEMATWPEATYHVDPPGPASQMGAEVEKPAEALLEEGSRRAGEIPGLRERLAVLKGPLRVHRTLQAFVQQRSRPEAATLVGLLDGTRGLDRVLANSPLDGWATLRILQRLQSVGALSAEGAEQERRGGLRLRVGMPIEYHGLGSWQQSGSFNLSEWGVFIRTAVPLDVSEQVVLRFELPGREAPLRIIGRVAWANPDPSKWGGMGMGIQFLDLTTADREAIERHLAQMIATQMIEATEHP